MRNQRFKQVFSQPEYLRTLQDGLGLLKRDPRFSGKVLVFEMGNPFNAPLDRVPPKGVDGWNHKGRTITQTLYRAPKEMVADGDVVMIPKAFTELSTLKFWKTSTAIFIGIQPRLHERLLAGIPPEPGQIEELMDRFGRFERSHFCGGRPDAGMLWEKSD